MNTDDSNLTQVEKKRKISTVYAQDARYPYDPNELTKIRKAIRLKVFPSTKFCKGEGRTKKLKTNKSKYLSPEDIEKRVGITHENPDLTTCKGYAIEVLKSCANVNDNHLNLSHMATWWNTYNKIVLRELRNHRAVINYRVKQSCINGKIYVCSFIFLQMKHVSYCDCLCFPLKD